MYLPLASAIAVLVIGAFVYLQNRRVSPPVGLVAVVLIAVVFWHGDVRQEPRLSQRRGAVARHGEQAPGECPRAPQLRDDPAREGRIGEAEQQLRDAIRLRPDHAEAHAALGAALCAQQRFAEGLEHLNTALTIAPDFAGAHQSLGEAYASQGQMWPALAAYERALALRPDDVMVMNRIGWILATDAEDSIRNGARALRAGPARHGSDPRARCDFARYARRCAGRDGAVAERGQLSRRWRSRAHAPLASATTFRSSKSASGSIGSPNRLDRTSRNDRHPQYVCFASDREAQKLAKILAE